MTQHKKLLVGESDFKTLRKADAYYVDKSLLIQEVIQHSDKVLLLPRPRRFGKTLNLSMLRYFFDKNEPDNQTLFQGLKIWEAEDHIKSHCGKYPVIFLTFKEAKGTTWQSVFRRISEEIIKAYEQHAYLLSGDVLLENQKAKFNRILNNTGDAIDFEFSLQWLSEYLERYHNEKVILLIDEYDTPIQSGYETYYSEAVEFMRGVLSAGLKDNSSLHRGVVTGILRVSKESIFSGLNNLGVYSILSNQFSDKFGFTELEVRQVIKDFDLKTDYASIKSWYNGYKVGDMENIYNPWSIIRFASSQKETFENYWVNTSSNSLIKQAIQKKDAALIREDVLNLMKGGSVVNQLEPNFVFVDLERNNTLLWTLLVYSGYLTVKQKVSRKEYELVIPNYELETVFQDTVLEWLTNAVQINDRSLKRMVSGLINNNLQSFEENFREVMGDTFSYYDTAKNPEQVYHTYLLGLLTIMGNDYVLRSNRESGGGRYDILLIPHDKLQNGVVMELKQIRKRDEQESDKDFAQRINPKLKEALVQMESNQYYRELLDHGIAPERVVKVPVVFAGKIPYIIEIKNKGTNNN